MPRDYYPLFYSLIESAKLGAVEPRAYLWKTNLRAIGNPGTVALARHPESSEYEEKTGA